MPNYKKAARGYDAFTGAKRSVEEAAKRSYFQGYAVVDKHHREFSKHSEFGLICPAPKRTIEQVMAGQPQVLWSLDTWGYVTWTFKVTREECLVACYRNGSKELREFPCTFRDGEVENSVRRALDWLLAGLEQLGS